MRYLVVPFVVLFACLPAAADDAVPVPLVQNLSLEQARDRLTSSGLQLGTVYEISWERAKDRWLHTWAVGTVVAQAPRAGRSVLPGKKVAVIVAAEQDGRLPKRLPPPKSRPTPKDPTPSDPAPSPDEPSPSKPGASDPAPADPSDTSAPAPASSGEDAAGSDGDANGEAGAANPASPSAAAGDDVLATGSPEAPRPAPKPNRDIAPPLVGLDLAVAEQLSRDAQMTLHVERVAGHPVGRVLEQVPEAYEPRGPGGVIRVIVTAGGDFVGREAPPPEVHVDTVHVPELLDRTEAQALRILRDLRLVGQSLPATRGVPGRVTNQHPLPGERLAVGGLVKVYVAPASNNADESGNGAGDAKPAAATQPVSVPSPKPLSPASSTPMPKTPTVAAGFTWDAVPGASAYVLEIEEQSASGSWSQSVRKPVRKTAAMVELERLDTQVARPLRWRVRAVVGGVQGNPSAWVVLR